MNPTLNVISHTKENQFVVKQRAKENKQENQGL